jgi:diguanylate cyclase (GGDEF)-like protein
MGSMQEIQTTTSYWLVAISILTSIVASYVAFSFAERLARARGKEYASWLGSGAVAMGLGIWSMHYLGMLSVRMPMPVVYHIPTVLLSMCFGVMASGVVLFIVSRTELGPLALACGSVLLGAGIGAMHYTGMHAMRSSAVHHYHPVRVAGSLVVAVGFSWLALSIAFSIRRRSEPGEWLRLGAASLMGTGIAAMHYTAMAAVTFMPGNMPYSVRHTQEISTIGMVAVAFTTGLVLFGGLITTVFHRRVYDRLTEERDRLRAAAECSLDNLYICKAALDRSGEIEDFIFTFMNSNVEKSLGKPRSAMLGRTMREIRPMMHDLGHFELYKQVCLTGVPLIHEFKYVEATGSDKWVRIQAVKLREGVAITSSNITARKADEERILHLAQHDPLTGLINRNLLSDRIGQALERVKRHGGKAGVFLIDLDNFKMINDTLGHAAGDTVLVTVAKRLKGVVRATDSVSRIGGDEFVILIEETGVVADLERCAEKMLEAFLQPIQVGEQSLMVTCSVGMAVYPDSAESIDELLTRADVAMYSAKHRGKNQFDVYLPLKRLASAKESPSMVLPYLAKRAGVTLH